MQQFNISFHGCSFNQLLNSFRQNYLFSVIYIHFLPQDAEIDPDKDFPGMHIILNVGPKWGDFQASAGHTKLYLPESILIKATDHIKELQGKLRQSKKIAENLNMTESQVGDGGLSCVDVQEQEKMLVEAKSQHGISQALQPTFALPPPNYDSVQRGPTVPSQPHPHPPPPPPPQSHHHYPPHQPVVMQNTEDEYHRIHSRKVHPRRTAAEKQQLVDQIPDWLKEDGVVLVKIPGVREPVTGIVKFVGVLQVKGVDQLIAGVQLVSCKLGNTSAATIYRYIAISKFAIQYDIENIVYRYGRFGHFKIKFKLILCS